MADVDFEFGSPAERKATVYLEHVAGFEVADVADEIVFVTPEDLEKDADADPIALRHALCREYEEVSELSSEYLLRNLVLPNLPMGFFGDRDGEPVILGAAVEVERPTAGRSSLEYTRDRMNGVKIALAPTLGRLSRVCIMRDPRLGGYGVDWLTADRDGQLVSFFGGALHVGVRYDQASE